MAIFICGDPLAMDLKAKLSSMAYLFLGDVTVERRNYSRRVTLCAVYLSGPPVSLLGKELLRFPVRGAEIAVAVTADDGIVGEDGRHDADDSFANHCFLCKIKSGR